MCLLLSLARLANSAEWAEKMGGSVFLVSDVSGDADSGGFQTDCGCSIEFSLGVVRTSFGLLVDGSL